MTSSFIGPTNWPTMKSILTVFTIFTHIHTDTHTHNCIDDPSVDARGQMQPIVGPRLLSTESHVQATFVMARQSPQPVRAGAVYPSVGSQ